MGMKRRTLCRILGVISVMILGVVCFPTGAEAKKIEFGATIKEDLSNVTLNPVAPNKDLNNVTLDPVKGSESNKGTLTETIQRELGKNQGKDNKGETPSGDPDAGKSKGNNGGGGGGNDGGGGNGEGSTEKCGKSFLGFRAWYDGLPCEDGKIQAPKKETGDGATEKTADNLAVFIWTIVLNVVFDVSVAVGYIAIGFIIFGGYLYIMSQGDPGKMARGKKTLTAAIIGTVIAAASSVIVNTGKVALGINSSDWQKSNLDIQSAFNWAYGMAGLVAVVFIVKGGIDYMISQGDPAKVSKATRSIIYAVTGLVVVLLAAVITGFVLSSLGGGMQSNEG